MKCPQCESTNFIKKGKTSNGLYQRYKCSACGKNFSNSPNKRGGQTIGDRPMNPVERKRRSRSKQKKN